MTILFNWRFESDDPFLKSPLHTYSLRFKKERHDRRLSAHTSTSSTTRTEVARRPPMPLPISILIPNQKNHQPNTHIHSKER